MRSPPRSLTLLGLLGNHLLQLRTFTTFQPQHGLKMSWMDWGSRPKKSAATPPPLYAVGGPEEVKYCHSCGRVIGSRKSQTAKASSSSVKFCSERCKRHRLRPVDRRIEAAFATLLDGLDASSFAPVSEELDTTLQSDNLTSKPQDGHATTTNKKQKAKAVVKGDPRIIVMCNDVEALVFGSREDPEKTFGRRKNRARRGAPDGDVWRSVDMEEYNESSNSTIRNPPEIPSSSAGEESLTGGSDAGSATAEDPSSSDYGVPMADKAGGKASRVRPPQSKSDVNGSIGGEKGWAERIDETPEMLHKRQEGQRKADEREMVRSAARRAVVFGVLRSQAYDAEVIKGKADGGKDQGERRLCEAVMSGVVVEPSYAKGDWGIRFREK